MKRKKTVSTPWRGLFSLVANAPLRLKLYIGLGTSIIGLLIVASVTSYTSIVNQQMVSGALTRQRQLADRTSEISDILLDIQNRALEFYNSWASTGFEQMEQGGFERAYTIYVAPIREQIEQIRHNIATIEQLEPDEQTRANLAKVLSSMDAYETTLLQMSSHMENLGFAKSGEVGQIQATTTELHDRLDEAGLETLYIILLQTKEHEKEFLLHTDLASARLTQDMITQLQELIAAADDDQIAPADKAQFHDLLEHYRDHFLAAANHLILVDQNQETLINQSDLISVLIGNMFRQQQAEFSATVERLQRRQFNITLAVIGLALLTFSVSGLVVYIIANQITRPVQMLGEAARQLGTGALGVRAVVHGGDEIGVTATAFNLMADQLQTVLTNLERRVAARTRGLQAAAEVSRAITSVLDLDELLDRVVNLAHERFNLYYVGLFLVDAKREFAVLRAGTGEAGQKMLALGHKLGVGGESMIGQCVAGGEARIALDVGEEAARFDNPHLPDTRSEMALPLRTRERVIGAMTVQSVEEAAFDEADISILQTMADQVAVAIDNARLFAEAQAALKEMEATQRRYLGQAWAEYLQATQKASYDTERPGATVLDDAVRPEILQAVERQGAIALQNDAHISSHAALVAPIALRGEIIGAVGVHADRTRQWTNDDIALVEAVTERMALAADNLRLLQETQRSLGEAEALYSASQAIGAASSVEEVGQALIDFASNSGIDAARVLLFEHDERGEPTYMVMREGWTVDERPAQPYGTRLLLADYPLADLMHPHKPIVVQDILTDERANEMARNLVTMISGLRSFIMVPITVGTRWIGMIFAGRNEPSAFAEELVRGYETLTGQAAVALESIRLLAETRQRAEREQLISAVTTRIRESLDMEIVLQTAVREIGETLGLHDAMVQLNVDADLMDRQNIKRVDL